MGGYSNVANIARAIGAFWSSSVSGSKREASLRIVDRMILDLMGKVESEESPARAAERHAMTTGGSVEPRFTWSLAFRGRARIRMQDVFSG